MPSRLLRVCNRVTIIRATRVAGKPLCRILDQRYTQPQIPGVKMLKLKKIHSLGFKSFCDRTELTVPGSGIAVVVGPNGCGKSNILDGVSWVLGEQSAKSLRGANMQDVIFAGTRDRKALGMAEVTLTLADPEVYEGPIPVEAEVAVDQNGPMDWDEEEVRRLRAAEAEEIIAAE